MGTALLVFLILVLAAALVALLGIYGTTKLALTRAENERERLAQALSLARGHLFGVSSDLPGVSDSAIRTLDAIDTAMEGINETSRTRSRPRSRTYGMRD